MTKTPGEKQPVIYLILLLGLARCQTIKPLNSVIVTVNEVMKSVKNIVVPKCSVFNSRTHLGIIQLTMIETLVNDIEC